jgi:hypothetical protein
MHSSSDSVFMQCTIEMRGALFAVTTGDAVRFWCRTTLLSTRAQPIPRLESKEQRDAHQKNRMMFFPDAERTPRQGATIPEIHSTE